MPQAANIVIAKDGVPTNVTFEPVSVGDESVFQDKSATTLAGRGSIRLRHQLAQAKSAGRTKLIIKVPVEGTVDGAVQVLYEDTVIIDVICHQESSSTNRAELRTLAKNALDNALIAEIIDEGARVW